MRTVDLGSSQGNSVSMSQESQLRDQLIVRLSRNDIWFNGILTRTRHHAGGYCQPIRSERERERERLTAFCPSTVHRIPSDAFARQARIM
jgi:hypothetical protein